MAGRPREGVNGTRVRDYRQVSFRLAPTIRRQFYSLVRQMGVTQADMLALLVTSWRRGR